MAIVDSYRYRTFFPTWFCEIWVSHIGHHEIYVISLGMYLPVCYIVQLFTRKTTFVWQQNCLVVSHRQYWRRFHVSTFFVRSLSVADVNTRAYTGSWIWGGVCITWTARCTR